MRYNVTLIWPPTYRMGYLLTDICRLMAAGIRGAGHPCNLTMNQLDEQAINVVVAAHVDGNAPSAIRKSVPRYIPLQTDWLRLAEDEGSVESDFLGARFESRCREYYEGAECVWDMYEHNLPLLQRFDIGLDRIRLVRSVGYHPDMLDIHHRPWREKDIDVLFFGSVTKRRGQVLQALRKQGANVMAVTDATAAFRNDLIARAKVNLNLHSTDAYRHLSLSRIGYLLNNRCAILSETANTNPELQDLMVCADYDDLVPVCMDLLASGQVEAIAEHSFAAYQEAPMADLVRDLVGEPG